MSRSPGPGAAGGRERSGPAPRAGGAAARRRRTPATRRERVKRRCCRRPQFGRARRPGADVPNSLSNTVDVISQRTLKIVAQFPVGALPQHVTPSYDLRTLYVDNDLGNTLTPIDPRTAKPGRPIPVEDPYNLCFTPDGRFAIVVAERLQRLDFRDPNTMRLVHSLPVPECRGVDHMDFSADGRYGFASCEFAGRMIGALRGSTTTLLARLRMRPGACPAMLGHGFGSSVLGCGGSCARITASRLGSSRLRLAGRASRASAVGDRGAARLWSAGRCIWLGSALRGRMCGPPRSRCWLPSSRLRWSHGDR